MVLNAKTHHLYEKDGKTWERKEKKRIRAYQTTAVTALTLLVQRAAVALDSSVTESRGNAREQIIF